MLCRSNKDAQGDLEAEEGGVEGEHECLIVFIVVVVVNATANAIVRTIGVKKAFS